MGKSAETQVEKLILERIDKGVVLQDAQGRIRYANPAAVRILALDEDELLRRASDDGTWDTVDAHGAPLRPEADPATMALRTGEPVRGQLLGIRRPRVEDRIWVLVDAFPGPADPGSKGPARDVVVLFRPVSREAFGSEDASEAALRLEAAAASRTAGLDREVQDLRESESGHRAMIRAMAEGVAVHGRDGQILRANPAAEEILGLTLDQMQGRHPVDPAWQLTRPDGSPLPPEEIPSEITRRTGEPCRNHLLRVRRSGGDEAWLSVNTARIEYDGEGAPWEVVATFTDVTVEQAALAAVEAGRDRLRNITEAVPGLILENLLTEDGQDRILFASAAAVEVVGVTPETLMESPEALWGRLDPGDRERLREHRARAVERREEMDEEFRIRDPEGRHRWIRLRAGPPRPAEGGLVFQMILLDVTEQRRMVRAIFDSQRREGLGVLAAGIAHNFNNLLAAILPTLELGAVEGSGEVAAAMEDGLEAARSAADLVRELLLLAGHTGEGEAEVVDLGEVVNEVSRVCSRTFDPRVTLETAGAGEALPVVARRSDLQQVLLNLALNARDAVAGVDGPAVSIRVSREGNRARVRIRDNGPGIPESVEGRLGEPFFTTKPQGEGTGLGLASAMGIVRALGGTLEWSSEAGRGATFTVGLPLRPEQTVPPGSPGAGAPSGETAPGSDGDAHRGWALVVDDEPLVRNTVVRMVERLGFRVYSTDDGAAALAWLAGNDDPRAVLLDLSMPGLSGLETLDGIRENGHTTPVILMSGYLPDDEVPDGVAAVLRKPMSFQDLEDALERALAWSDASGVRDG